MQKLLAFLILHLYLLLFDDSVEELCQSLGFVIENENDLKLYLVQHGNLQILKDFPILINKNVHCITMKSLVRFEFLLFNIGMQ